MVRFILGIANVGKTETLQTKRAFNSLEKTRQLRLVLFCIKHAFANAALALRQKANLAATSFREVTFQHAYNVRNKTEHERVRRQSRLEASACVSSKQ